MTEWALEHTIECGVSAAFAWDFWTPVGNWALDADVESVELLGSFAAGTRGITHSKSSGRIEWRLAEVVAPTRAVLEFLVPGVEAKFIWTFEEVAGRARITQRASRAGEQIAELAEAIGGALEAGIPAGMRKLCDAMETAARRIGSASN